MKHVVICNATPVDSLLLSRLLAASDSDHFVEINPW